MNKVETKRLMVGRTPFEVDVLDEEDFEDGERVQICFNVREGVCEYLSATVKVEAHSPTIFDPYDSAYRLAYFVFSFHGTEVTGRLAGLEVMRLCDHCGGGSAKRIEIDGKKTNLCIVCRNEP